MQGAREYAGLFETGQYGRLYITSGSHARGKTFEIQVLPEGEVARGNGQNNKCLNENAVVVYGIVSGSPGWTEVYGWLHGGKWQDDFQALLGAKRTELTMQAKADEVHSREAVDEERNRIEDLLRDYN